MDSVYAQTILKAVATVLFELDSDAACMFTDAWQHRRNELTAEAATERKHLLDLHGMVIDACNAARRAAIESWDGNGAVGECLSDAHAAARTARKALADEVHQDRLRDFQDVHTAVRCLYSGISCLARLLTIALQDDQWQVPQDEAATIN